MSEIFKYFNLIIEFQRTMVNSWTKICRHIFSGIFKDRCLCQVAQDPVPRGCEPGVPEERGDGLPGIARQRGPPPHAQRHRRRAALRPRRARSARARALAARSWPPIYDRATLARSQPYSSVYPLLAFHLWPLVSNRAQFFKQVAKIKAHLA